MSIVFKTTKIAIYFCFIKYTAFLFGFAVTGHTQVYDNFENTLSSEWEPSTPGRWNITNQEPISGEQSLQHVYNNPDAGEDQIALNHTLLMLDSANTTWTFRIRHGQAPSSSNNWCVFLVADGDVDQLHPENMNNAYCIGVNFTGSDDLLKLWKVENGNVSTLINTGLNWQDSIGIEKAPYIKIERSPDGQWEIFMNTEGENTPSTSMGTAMDNHWNVSTTFGIHYAYTKTYDQVLWFDDLAISGYFYEDQSPPVITDAYFLTDTLLHLQLNEIYSPGSMTPDQFLTVPEMDIQQVIPFSSQEIRLALDTPVENNGTLDIQISGITDLSGNMMPDTSIQVSYVPAQADDMIITEIMADPSPPVGLPEAEYIELYNAADHTINLYHWKLQVGDRIFQLPDMMLQPHGYLIVCKNDQAPLFEVYGNTLPLFTSVYTLRNEGDTIRLANEKDETINEVIYHDQLHSGQGKQDGGWSLEIIDPDNQCNPRQNWSSSIDPSGGTPGQPNAIHAYNRDTVKPTIRGGNMTLSGQIEITLSEPVQMSLLRGSDIAVKPGLGNPTTILTKNDTTLRISFTDEPVPGTVYELSIQEITDLCGNTNQNVTVEIPYYQAHPYDVLITEIMADPTPSYGLPEEEYIEIVNNSAFRINLDQWQLMVNDNQIILPPHDLHPNDHILLTNASSQNAFADSTRVIPGANLPPLPNSEGTITLLDSNSQVMHAVHYRSTWVESAYKKEGGWSLEMIDRANPCGGRSNWRESEFYMGGTPGWDNSVNARLPDHENPYVTRIGYRNDSSIRVHFNEPLDTTSLNNYFFRIDDQHTPDSLVFEFPMHRYADLYFNKLFEPEKQYTLFVTSGYADCAGNTNRSGQEIKFGEPQLPEKNDMIINEVLFNPVPGGADYLELYNRSDKIIDLRGLDLARIDDNDHIQAMHTVTESSYLVYPKGYILLTLDTTWVTDYYEVCEGILVKPVDMPGMANDEGHIGLINAQLERIDQLQYSSSWHSGWVKNESGVALERLHMDSPAQHADNWASGTAATRYGSPACENANYMDATTNAARFKIDPQLFTPNGDGYHDETVFYYNLGEGNYILHVTIFNSNGQMVTRLKQDELVGHKGFFTWDGRNNNDQLCPIGIYLVYAEFVSDQGQVEVFKETCVLGKKVE